MPKSETAGHRDRVKKAFLAGDPAAVTDEALLELLLYQVVPIQDVKLRCNALLTEHGTLAGVLVAEGEWPTRLRAATELIRCLAAALPVAATPQTLRPAGALTEPDHPALFEAADLHDHGRAAPPAIEQEQRLAPTLCPALQEGADPALPPSPRPDSDPEGGAADARAHKSPTEATADERSEARVLLAGPAHDAAIHEESAGVRIRVRQGIAGTILLREAVRILPELARMQTELEARAYLRDNLWFNSAETRQRNASYLFQQVFSNGFPDRALQEFASRFAGMPDLLDVCYYRLCLAEPLLTEVAEELLIDAVKHGSLDRMALRRFLQSLYPASKSVDHYGKSIVSALTAGGVAKASSAALLLRYRDMHLKAFAFVVHGEFPEPGMHRIDDLLERPAVRAMLWRPEQLLPGLYELRNRGILPKISEIDRFRQFTTQWTPTELSAHLDQEVGSL